VWPVTLACEVLGVSTSGYFEHQRRRSASQPSRPGARRLSNEALLAHIRAIHAEVKGEYGWPRVWKELLARGMRVGKDRVQRLMKLHGIKARGKRKFVVTTDSKHEPAVAENLLAGTSRRRRPTGSGAATSPTSPPTKAGCTWRR
jgi:putative transposase